MKNDDSMNYWTKIANNNPTEKSVKVSPKNDFTNIDASFILKHTNSSTEILDLASGTGLVINKIHSKVKSIVAIEKFREFSKYILKADNITVYNCDIVIYVPDRLFDLITMFGIVQYFNEEEIKSIYYKYINYLKDEGKIIIKNQFGILDDIVVSGYSEELKTQYFSQYRHIEKEIRILREVGFKNINTIDIYPPECNRWSNTHYFALVAEK